MKPFYIIDGPDGSGKGTQIELVKNWMEELGLKVCVSEEPNGTIDGGRIREMLLFTRKERMNTDFSEDEREWLADYFDLLSRRISESAPPDCEYLVGELEELSSCARFNARIEITLFVAGRLLHLQEVILPFIRGETDDDVLLVDRFHPSTYAYQIFALSESLTKGDTRFVHGLYEWHMRHLLEELRVIPQIIIIDVPVETSVLRLSSRPGRSSYYDQKKQDFLGQVREGYLTFLKHWIDMAGHVLDLPGDLVHIVDGSGTREETFDQIRQVLEEDIVILMPQIH